MALEKGCCSAACGVTVAGAGSTSSKHWNAPTGTPTVETDVSVHGSTHAFKVTSAAGEAVYLFRTILPAATQNKASIRFYIHFDALPSADCILATFAAAAGGFPNLRFVAADSTLQASLNNSSGAGGGVVVASGQSYCVDMLVDMSSGTRTVDVKVNGVAVTQASVSVAASTISNFRLGGNTNGIGATTANYTHRFAHLTYEFGVVADSFTWPIGPGKVLPLRPNADGTHSFDDADLSDFVRGADGSTTPVALGATTAWQEIDEILTDLSSMLGVNEASVDEYLEFQYENLPASGFDLIHCVTHVSSHKNASVGTANRQSLRLVDGGSTAEIVNNLDLSEVTAVYHHAAFPGAPSGGAWTKAKVDALRTRFAGAFSGQTINTDAIPQMFGSLFEVSINETEEEGGGGTDSFVKVLIRAP